MNTRRIGITKPSANSQWQLPTIQDIKDLINNQLVLSQELVGLQITRTDEDMFIVKVTYLGNSAIEEPQNAMFFNNLDHELGNIEIDESILLSISNNAMFWHELPMGKKIESLSIEQAKKLLANHTLYTSSCSLISIAYNEESGFSLEMKAHHTEEPDIMNTGFMNHFDNMMKSIKDKGEADVNFGFCDTTCFWLDSNIFSVLDDIISQA